MWGTCTNTGGTRQCLRPEALLPTPHAYAPPLFADRNAQTGLGVKAKGYGDQPPIDRAGPNNV